MTKFEDCIEVDEGLDSSWPSIDLDRDSSKERARVTDGDGADARNENPLDGRQRSEVAMSCANRRRLRHVWKEKVYKVVK